MSKKITDRRYPLPEQQRCLTRKYELVKSDGVLTSVTLYDHQRVIIAAMIAIENERKFTLANGDVVFSSSGLLSEPGGSGKTFICLALIVLQKMPRPFPAVYGVTDPNAMNMTMTRKVTTPGALLQSTLVIVGTSVFRQWYQNISEHTKKIVCTIENYHGLRKFQVLLEKKAVSRYPVVLMRAAPVSGTFEIDGVKYPNVARSSIEVMKLLTQRYCWARVIIDDYDTIGIPQNAPVVNTFFTWYVSASRKSHTNVCIRKMIPLETQIKEDPTILGALRCPLLNGLYNIRVSNKFRRASKSIPKIRFYKYIYDNPDDAYIRALHGVNDEGVREMIQMLNGDAVGEAAAALNIEATCVADIFKKMLDDKYDIFINSKKQLEFLNEQCEVLNYLDEREDRQQHSDAVIEKIKKKITKLKDPDVTYYSRKLENAYEEFRMELTQNIKKSGIAIERMIDNIRMGGCQVCKLDIDKDTSVFIVKCCGLVICNVCFPNACKLNTVHYDRMSCKYIRAAKCAQCTKFLNIKSDIIFLDRNFDIEKLLNAKGDEQHACDDCGGNPCTCEEEVQNEPDAPDDAHECTCEEDPCVCKPLDPKDIKNPKVRALIQIIRGETPELREKFHRTNAVLMQGDQYVPVPANVPKKVIVFAHYEETLDKITEQLIAFGIQFLRVSGSANEVFETLQKFRKGKYTVLLINSSQRCAGMDMPFVTDEVFMHEVLDKHVAGQLAARAQRFGRECSLNIHYLCYHNENLLM